jgi:hypothetical protein
MAMLMTNSVFSETWGEKAGSPPEKEFWEDIITTVKDKYPDFKFIAEVYWDMEWDLLQQGFDFCYDKRLYERLVSLNVENIRNHLKAEVGYQNKLLRFIENHDEPRAFTTFGIETSMAASVITNTLPGASLIFEGQTRGCKLKVPVQLGRGPIEEDNEDIVKFYNKLLRVIPRGEFDEAKWSLCDNTLAEQNDNSFQNIISYQWFNTDQTLLIVVNYSSAYSKAHIITNDIDYGFDNWRFIDLLTGKEYNYKGKDLEKHGLYIELDGWKSHIFRVERM